jgi:hypothetical protein
MSVIDNRLRRAASIATMLGMSNEQAARGFFRDETYCVMVRALVRWPQTLE